MDDFLAKPFSDEQLRQAISACLNLNRREVLDSVLPPQI